MTDTTSTQFGRADGKDTHRFTFSGNAKEYFGIWIVNIILTIITLGIYSAWAKVRRNRYFYGNTALADGRFDYHARPIQILIGQIIVIGFLIAYNVFLTIMPLVGIVLAVIFLIAIPWLIARGLRFSARVTSYRNVRFDFTGGYWGAVKSFFLGPLLAMFTLGICAPIASRWMLRYTLGNILYGGREFKTQPGLGPLYGVWWLPALITLAGSVFVGFAVAPILFGSMEMTTADLSGNPSPINIILLFLPLYILLFVGGSAVQALYSAGVRNVGFSATTFDSRHSLSSSIPRWRYVWVIFSNLVVTICSLGLMRPWAAIRLTKFQTEHTAMQFDGEVGEILSTIKDSGSAVGAEFISMEGITVGF
jgi:uncharacterized membrane protein YjgN (DUF898 family)